MSIDDLPDLPLDEPLSGPPAPYRRPDVVAPAPRWSGPLFGILAVLLIPWIVYLGVVLPDRTTSAHWDVAWVGFDAMEFLALALTGWLSWRRSTWVVITATAAATLLVVDAWFDITTASGGWDLVQAVVLGGVLELPLAVVALLIARHAEQVNERATMWLIRRSTRQAMLLRRLGGPNPAGTSGDERAPRS
jgi:hypothetical protein